MDQIHELSCFRQTGLGRLGGSLDGWKLSRIVRRRHGHLDRPDDQRVGRGPGTRVLDLCCAHGAGTGALLAAGADVTGLDFSPAMLRQPKGVPLPLGPSTITWVRGSENVAWAIFLGSATGTAAPNRSSARWTLDLHVQNAALHSVLSRMTIKCPVFCQRLMPFALQYSNILGFHAHPPTHTHFCQQN